MVFSTTADGTNGSRRCKHLTRRHWLRTAASACTAIVATSDAGSPAAQPLDRRVTNAASDGPNWMVASCMYGTMPLSVIAAEMRKLGCSTLDLWPRVHGDQREQAVRMGADAFRLWCEDQNIRIGCLSAYRLGIENLRGEILAAAKWLCPTVVVHGGGKPQASFDSTRRAIDAMVGRADPTLRMAADHGVTVMIENHGSSMVDTVEATLHLADAITDTPAKVALAPAHLPQDADALADLVRRLRDRLGMFYAWQYGNGFREKMPVDKECAQLPGQGPLDFGPIVSALAEINFRGFTEVMMHPTPRGIPIAETAGAVTQCIHRSHQYLESHWTS